MGRAYWLTLCSPHARADGPYNMVNGLICNSFEDRTSVGFAGARGQYDPTFLDLLSRHVKATPIT